MGSQQAQCLHWCYSISGLKYLFSSLEGDHSPLSYFFLLLCLSHCLHYLTLEASSLVYELLVNVYVTLTAYTVSRPDVPITLQVQSSHESLSEGSGGGVGWN